MDNKQAIDLLDNLIGMVEDNQENDYDTALCMAIDTLKQPEIIRCGECIYRYVEGKKVRFNRCRLDHNNIQSDDWYCADAERRTND